MGRKQPTAVVEDIATYQARYEIDHFDHPTSIGVISRRVFRRQGSGPAVILIHEAPGISVSTFRIAELLANKHFTVVLPEVLDVPPPRANARTMLRICVARELGALAHGSTSAIAEWLRALADREWAATGERPVGVVGMCFSGGFALATVLNGHVGAAVMSQPALPFFWLRDLGVNPDELGRIQDRVRDGACLRALRFGLDWKSPAPRFHHLQKAFPTMEHAQVWSLNPNDHSVLARGLDAADGSKLKAALTDTITFLERSLLPAAGG